MTVIEDVLPMLGLRIVAGPIELRGLSDADLATLTDVAGRGVHDPERMPFNFPWTDASADELPLNFAQYHWRSRADFSHARWNLDLGVWYDGQLVGVQGFSTSNFLVTRTGESGSWLGREHHGHGIGTAMRQMICAFAFDHLDADEVTSAAFTDNPESQAVSRKVGYRENGLTRQQRRPGEMATQVRLLLTPENFRRGEHELEVTGLAAFRRSIGLDACPE